MSDNLTTTTTVSTVPNSTIVGTAEAAFSGQTVHAQLMAPAVISGAEGSRKATLLGVGAKSATYITTAAGTDDNVLPAISAGTQYAITRITITLDEACTVGVGVRLGFGTANVPALGASQADAVDDILVYHPGMVPGSGIQIGDGSGILGIGGDGAELRITNEVPTGGTLAVTVTYCPIA